MRRLSLPLLAAFALLFGSLSGRSHAQAYTVTNLVSDGSVPAVTMDPNFLDPWGISVSPTWWINTANSGFSFVVSPSTNAIPFKVKIPKPSSSDPGSPTGCVTTSGATGMVLSNGSKASFLFATLEGAIYGWNGALGTNGSTAIVAIDNSGSGASYPGLALLNANATTSYILAPNFGTAKKIEVYDGNFHPTSLSGSFTDPNLPSGYAPWSIHILKNQIWVAYALRTTTAPFDEVPGPGNGIVDVFDLNGNFVARAVTGGNLNAPWGIAFAPANFGIYSNDLLIGNFGDGKINVYDPKTFAYLGQLMDSTGKSLVYASLWDLLAGGTPILNSTAVSGGNTSTLYFAAGLKDEGHGLFAGIASATVPNAPPAFGFTTDTSSVTVTAGNPATVNLSLAPVNGFSGSVTLACSGLPTGASCVFTPGNVAAVGASAPSTIQMTIDTRGMPQKMGALRPQHLRDRSGFVFSLAALVPFSLLLVRRRRVRDRLTLLTPFLLIALGSTALILGCGGSYSPPPVVTPAGQSQVTLTATGPSSLTQQATVTLNVQ